jgi:co-chaperonin GroES (HSP10)
MRVLERGSDATKALDALKQRDFGQWVIEPRGDWVLIQKIEKEDTKTGGNVILPGGGKSNRGIVVAAPEKDTKDRPTKLETGDAVIFTNFPQFLEDLEDLTGQKNLYLVRVEEIYAKLHRKSSDGSLQELCSDKEN